MLFPSKHPLPYQRTRLRIVHPRSSRVPTERLPAQEQEPSQQQFLILLFSSEIIRLHIPIILPSRSTGRISHRARRGGRRCHLPWPCLPSARLRQRPCGCGRGTGRGSRICWPSPARASAVAASSRPAAPLPPAAPAGAFLLREPGRSVETRGGRRACEEGWRVGLCLCLCLCCEM